MTLNDPPCRDRRVRRVIQHIIQDLTRQPRMAELASLAGLERTYFCRHFHQTVGVRFSTWSRQVRAEQAKHLLAHTDLPISTIATEVGYDDVTTFERNFRRCQNCSPRQYRKAQRQAERTPHTIVADNYTTSAENSTTSAETACRLTHTIKAQ
jgi:AraC-like DNA-binding protein